MEESNNLKWLKILFTTGIALVAITYYILDYFYQQNIKSYKNEIASISKNLITKNGKQTKYQFYESYIQLQIEDKQQIEELIKKENPHTKQLSQTIKFYFNNYINREISDNFANLIELNRIKDSNDNTNLVYNDNILYIKNYVTNDKFIIYDEKVVIVLKDAIVNILARIVTTDGISNNSEYFMKWINNLKVVKN